MKDDEFPLYYKWLATLLPATRLKALLRLYERRLPKCTPKLEEEVEETITNEQTKRFKLYVSIKHTLAISDSAELIESG